MRPGRHLARRREQPALAEVDARVAVVCGLSRAILMMNPQEAQKREGDGSDEILEAKVW